MLVLGITRRPIPLSWASTVSALVSPGVEGTWPSSLCCRDPLTHPQIWDISASRVLRKGFPDHIWMGIYFT